MPSRIALTLFAAVCIIEWAGVVVAIVVLFIVLNSVGVL
jgi:hypothetical protein